MAVAAVVAVVVLRRPAPAPPAPAPVWPTLVSTFAGAGAPGFAQGRGAEAAFADPFGVAIDPAGNTYLSDAGDNNLIWRISANGTAMVVAGSREGFADGDGPAASFNTPSGLALDRVGYVIVADTANHAIRRVTPAGHVDTIAGNGQPGYRDGAGRQAQFNGPIGVAVAGDGAILVADSYNDRIRRIDRAGTVTTLAGGTEPGWRDGPRAEALFDTPSGIAVDRAGTIYVADTGNDAVRRIGSDGQVTTVTPAAADMLTMTQRAWLFRPVGIAAGGGGEVYVTDGSGRVMLLPPGGEAMTVAGGGAGFANGAGTLARFRDPAGIAVAPDGTLRVADSDNALVRRIVRPSDHVPPSDIDLTPVPLLTATTLGIETLAWPLDPQREWHEVAATLGEARGSPGGDGRERLHSGIDVQGPIGSVVRAVRDEKVARPIGNGPFGSANESLRVGVVSYVHMRVGRTARGKMLDPDRFVFVHDERGRPARVRVRRGTRFHVGDALGTLNALSHVHMDIGPRGAEINALSLSLAGFADHVAPTILPRGVRFFSEAGEEFASAPAMLPAFVPGSSGNSGEASPQRGRASRPRGGGKPRPTGAPGAARGPTPAGQGFSPATPVLSGRVSIVVEAFDRVDGNRANRRLGVYVLGYQVLRRDRTPAPGFEQPRMTLVFDRLPSDPEAPQLVYAEGSGITVCGNKTTRFRYIVTNALIDGVASRGTWDASSLPAGEYVVRIVAADRSGNTTTRDVSVAIR